MAIFEGVILVMTTGILAWTVFTLRRHAKILSGLLATARGDAATLREANVALREATALEGFVSFIAQLNSAKMVRARELLYQNKGKVEYLSSQDKTSIKVILILLDQMGTLVIKKLIPEDVAIEMYWDVVIKDRVLNNFCVFPIPGSCKCSTYSARGPKCWDASKSWIKKEEQERGGDQSADGARANGTKNGPSNKYDDYEFYPDNKPEPGDYRNYHETLYENFKVLVYRCEKYCAERGLTRPVVY